MNKTDLENEKLRRHVQAWTVAADVLACERIVRLRAMTDEDTRQAIVQLFSQPIQTAPVKGSSTSGLAEQQRLFRRLR
jgi:limonene-1,2-epoxide hydrolase